MTKIGIDIVDLHDPQLKHRNERALKLILHPDDQLIEHPHLYWLLWSAKEAIFKCQREALNFSPSSIPVKLVADGEAISFTSEDLTGTFEVTEQYVVAVCGDQKAALDYATVATEQVSTSQTVRDYIVGYFQKKGLDFAIGADDLNLPTLLPKNVPISISHHLHWSAFAYPKSVTE